MLPALTTMDRLGNSEGSQIQSGWLSQQFAQVLPLQELATKTPFRFAALP